MTLTFMPVAASAADRIEGRVEAGGAPISGADVTLWLAGPGAPEKLAEAKTDDDGSYDLTLADGRGGAGVLYLIAAGGEARAAAGKGSNPATMLMATLGAVPPARVTINEFTTVASVWTGAQFLDGGALSGDELGLRIAAGNVPNLVDLETGGLGPVIVDPLNGPQTTTLAKLNTLGILLSACVTAIENACDKLFDAATPPGGAQPTDTLTAARNIARHPSHNADRLFGLLDAFHPVPEGKRYRAWRIGMDNRDRVVGVPVGASAWLETLPERLSQASNGVAGSVENAALSTASRSPIEPSAPRSTASWRAWQRSSSIALSASMSGASGIGTMKVRRPKPTIPSTLPLSLPLPGRPKRARNR